MVRKVTQLRLKNIKKQKKPFDCYVCDSVNKILAFFKNNNSIFTIFTRQINNLRYEKDTYFYIVDGFL